MRRIWIGLGVLGFAFSLSAQEVSSSQCLRMFEFQEALPPEIQNLAIIEQTENPSHPLPAKGSQRVPVLHLQRDQVVINGRADLSESLRDFFFLDKDQFLWPIKNPQSRRSIDIAFDHVPPTGYIWGQYSASRSMFFVNQGKAFSIKLPSSVHGEAKTDLRKSVIISRLRSDTISEVDARLGVDRGLITLLDVLSVADPASGNGFVVRSLERLQDGNSSVPGFAMKPYFERAARKMRLPIEQVVEEYYARPYGMSLAKMLVRYGLLMVYAHDQNYLVRFTPEGLPLKEIAWRDLSDTQPVPWMLDAMGLSHVKQVTLQNNYFRRENIELFIKNVWWFHTPIINRDVVKERVEFHFLVHVYELLQVPRPPTLTLQTLETFLRSKEGQNAIRRFHNQPEIR